MDKLRNLFGSDYSPISTAEHYDDDFDVESGESRSFFEQVDEAVTLTRTERLTGFIICFVLGWFISFLSMGSLPIIVANPLRFAVLYSAGNLLSLCSTMFLYGPWKQVKSMFDSTRRLTTLVCYYTTPYAYCFIRYCVVLCRVVWNDVWFVSIYPLISYPHPLHPSSYSSPLVLPGVHHDDHLRCILPEEASSGVLVHGAAVSDHVLVLSLVYPIRTRNRTVLLI